LPISPCGLRVKIEPFYKTKKPAKKRVCKSADEGTCFDKLSINFSSLL